MAEERDEARARRAEERRRRRETSEKEARNAGEPADDDADEERPGDERADAGGGHTTVEAESDPGLAKAAWGVAAAGTVAVAALLARRLMRARGATQNEGEGHEADARSASGERPAEADTAKRGTGQTESPGAGAEEDLATVLKRTTLDVALAAAELLGSRDRRDEASRAEDERDDS